jgi:hypothetical protein
LSWILKKIERAVRIFHIRTKDFFCHNNEFNNQTLINNEDKTMMNKIFFERNTNIHQPVFILPVLNTFECVSQTELRLLVRTANSGFCGMGWSVVDIAIIAKANCCILKIVSIPDAPVWSPTNGNHEPTVLFIEKFSVS